MYLGIRRAGGNPVVRLPRRFSEGYGLNEKIIDEFDGDSLLITVDNGIAAAGAIAKAKKKGMTVIVTDHHLAPEGGKLPEDADIVIDPNAGTGADFTGYCGAGLAYRIIKWLLFGKNCEAFEAMAAIASVADCVPLKGENRVIVREGLEYVAQRKGLTTGLRALLDAMGVTSYVTTTSVGFKIGPAINAPGRLLDEGAMKSFGLVVFDGPLAAAKEMAEEIAGLNEKRKELCTEWEDAARTMIREKGMENDIPLVLYLPGLPEGIAGNIAGKLCGEYNTPVVMLTDAEPGVLKGSARTALGVHIKNILDENKQWLIGHGGHEKAAGLRLNLKYLDDFSKGMKRSCANVVKEEPVQYYDLVISPSEVTETEAEIERFGPYGEDVPAPVVMIGNASPNPQNFSASNCTYFKLIADEKAVKFNLPGFDAVGFELGQKAKDFKYGGKLMSFIGTLSRNFFNGNFTAQIELIDMKEERPPVRPTVLQAKLFQLAETRT